MAPWPAPSWVDTDDAPIQGYTGPVSFETAQEILAGEYNPDSVGNLSDAISQTINRIGATSPLSLIATGDNPVSSIGRLIIGIPDLSGGDNQTDKDKTEQKGIALTTIALLAAGAYILGESVLG